MGGDSIRQLFGSSDLDDLKGGRLQVPSILEVIVLLLVLFFYLSIPFLLSGSHENIACNRTLYGGYIFSNVGRHLLKGCYGRWNCHVSSSSSCYFQHGVSNLSQSFGFILCLFL